MSRVYFFNIFFKDFL